MDEQAKTIAELTQKLDAVLGQMQSLERRLLGPKTENTPPVAAERDEDTGANLAGLYSLVATCEAHDVDPVPYLKDALLRVDTHPASRIDELLPHQWTPPHRWGLAE